METLGNETGEEMPIWLDNLEFDEEGTSSDASISWSRCAPELENQHDQQKDLVMNVHSSVNAAPAPSLVFEDEDDINTYEELKACGIIPADDDQDAAVGFHTDENIWETRDVQHQHHVAHNETAPAPTDVYYTDATKQQLHERRHPSVLVEEAAAVDSHERVVTRAHSPSQRLKRPSAYIGKDSMDNTSVAIKTEDSLQIQPHPAAASARRYNHASHHKYMHNMHAMGHQSHPNAHPQMAPYIFPMPHPHQHPNAAMGAYGRVPPGTPAAAPSPANASHLDAQLKFQERQLIAQFHEIQLARHALQLQAQAAHMQEAQARAREQQDHLMNSSEVPNVTSSTTLEGHTKHITKHSSPAENNVNLNRTNSENLETQRHDNELVAANQVKRAASDDRHSAKRRLSDYQQSCISPKCTNSKKFAALGEAGSPSPCSVASDAQSSPSASSEYFERVTPESHATRVTKANRRRVCEFCLRKFQAQDELQQHRAKHILGENSFTCIHPNCNKTYSTGEGLRLHVRNVHLDAKIWKCLAKDCERSFVRQSDLRMHIIRIHSNIRPFPCIVDSCKKSFACHSELRRHVYSCHKLTCPKPEECKPVVNFMDLAFVKRLMLKVE